MNSGETQRIRFRLEGPAFEEGMPIHLVSTALTDLQAILDKPYLYIERKDRISKRDRFSFQVVASSMGRGSFVADLDIIYQAAQLTLPAVAAVGPDTVWEYTKETWKFLKLIYEKAKSGQKPTIQTNDNGTTNVIYGDTTVNFNAPVLVLGDKSLPHYKSFNSMAKSGGVREIDIGTPGSPEIILGQETRDLFKLPTKINPASIRLQCDFFDFNKYKNGGKLAVGPHEPLPEGEYNFSILGEQNQVQYIYSMLQPQVTVECLREEQVNPLGETKIVRLHIVAIAS